MEDPARFTVEVTEDGVVVAKKTFKHPPKAATEIEQTLQKAGFEGELQDRDGDTLSGDDPLQGGQTYVLLRVVPGMLLCACFA